MMMPKVFPDMPRRVGNAKRRTAPLSLQRSNQCATIRDSLCCMQIRGHTRLYIIMGDPNEIFHGISLMDKRFRSLLMRSPDRSSFWCARFRFQVQTLPHLDQIRGSGTPVTDHYRSIEYYCQELWSLPVGIDPRPPLIS